MSIVWTIVIGLIVGLVARLLHPGRDRMGFILTVLLGIAGSFIAGFIGKALGWYQPGEPAGFIASVVGAVLLLFLFTRFRSR